MTQSELHAAVDEAHSRWWARLQELYPALLAIPTPNWKFNKRLKACAGRVTGLRGIPFSWAVEYSYSICELNTENFLVDTVAHELAHVADIVLYPKRRSGHGPSWKRIMRDLGLEPEVYHDYKTEGGRYVASCDCMDTRVVGKVKLNAAKRGARYVCRRCKGYLYNFRVEE